MRNSNLVLALVLIAGVPSSAAQGQTAAKSLTSAQIVDEWVSNAETHLVPLAEAMPANKYSFAPVNGEFHGVRTFAQQAKHLAANNYAMAAKILGEKPAADQNSEEGPDSVRTKQDVIAYLKGSFAALHKAVATITTANQGAPIPGTLGNRQSTRLGWVIDAVAHSFNHYGQMVEYLRMNGIVPPASR
jgi:uncharacterized damage-inducible protein DinB